MRCGPGAPCGLGDGIPYTPYRAAEGRQRRGGKGGGAGRRGCVLCYPLPPVCCNWPRVVRGFLRSGANLNKWYHILIFREREDGGWCIFFMWMVESSCNQKLHSDKNANVLGFGFLFKPAPPSSLLLFSALLFFFAVNDMWAVKGYMRAVVSSNEQHCPSSWGRTSQNGQ